MLFFTALLPIIVMLFTASVGAAPVSLDARSNTGRATFYTPGRGACGWSSVSSDNIVAVSSKMFNSFGSQSNGNPVCGKKLRATYDGRSVTVKVVDKCVGCGYYDLDFSPSAFSALASEDIGSLGGVKWYWV
ncbi:RlpA-like double-psi beta-barrel-protein domain-containing protein-containing protein [Hysterangium stoloniferum]|nr:RlpA-like double-psi beta-barrel-protein domain-containing protein-containing protein [Hysterangium stoloniferum]